MGSKTKVIVRRVLETLAVASVVAAVGIADVQAAFAGCGPGCNHKHDHNICKSAMDQNGLKGPERKSEYSKCMLDPMGYK